MVDKLVDLIKHKNGTYFDDPGFKKVLEDHVKLLRETTTKILTVEPVRAIRYEGDFYGLLKEMGIPSEIHWLVAQMNYLDCSEDYRSSKLEIFLPEEGNLDILYSIYNSKIA